MVNDFSTSINDKVESPNSILFDVRDLKMWIIMSKDYPKYGKKGITHLMTKYHEEDFFESILFRNTKGKLLGLIRFLPSESRPYKDFNELTIVVHPKYWRKGIASKLLQEAIRMWDFSFNEQEYTNKGTELKKSFLRKQNQNVLARKRYC